MVRWGALALGDHYVYLVDGWLLTCCLSATMGSSVDSRKPDCLGGIPTVPVEKER
jgi:hypothetical protein